MDYFKLNLFIVGAFLLTSLIVGLWAGRKVTTMRDYALANKAYGTWPLMMTYVATVIGGGWIFGRAKDIFENGIGPAFVLLSYAIGMFLRAKYIAPKMLVFRNCLSLGDIFNEFYGSKSKVLAGVLSVIFSSIIVGLNVSFLGVVFDKFLGINAALGIIISTIVLVLYSMRGGIRAVTATDIIQFVLLFSTLLIVMLLAVKKLDGIENLFNLVPNSRFDFFGNKNIYSYSSLILTQILFFFTMVDPPQLDRMLMAKSTYHIKKMLNISGIVAISIVIMITIITFSALVLYPDVDTSSIMWHMITNLVPKWAQGFTMVGIIAILFSTADSYMHSAGVAVAHDIISPLKEKFGVKSNEIKLAVYSIIIVGLLAIWFALWGKNFLKPHYFVTVIPPILAAPMLLSIFGVKPDEKAFWTSAIAAGIALVFCMAADPAYHPIISGFALLISVSVSAITYMIVHININKGILIITNHGFNNPNRDIYQPREKDILYKIVDFLLYPVNFAKRCRLNVATYGTPPYALFGALYMI